ncbi:hypothetical protein CGI09_28650, partial [Vibrio parahaemolyticus]
SATAHNVKHLFKKCIEIKQSAIQTNFTGQTRIRINDFLDTYLPTNSALTIGIQTIHDCMSWR